MIVSRGGSRVFLKQIMYKMIDKIKQRLKVLGITKSHLAKNANMTSSELSHVLSGRRSLKPEQETAIKNYLGI